MHNDSAASVLENLSFWMASVVWPDRNYLSMGSADYIIESIILAGGITVLVSIIARTANSPVHCTLSDNSVINIDFEIEIE